jgi:secretion/DNA translocation related TadE-like protein
MSERGSGSILGVAIIGFVVSIALMVIPLYMGLVARASVQGAADASALAGADVASGFASGDPCAVARRVASANRTILDRCAVDGLVVTVVASTTYMSIRISSTAMAGPPTAVTN